MKSKCCGAEVHLMVGKYYCDLCSGDCEIIPESSSKESGRHLERCSQPTAKITFIEKEPTDTEMLDWAIVFPRQFTKLMESQAHGGMQDKECQRGRDAIRTAMKKGK